MDSKTAIALAVALPIAILALISGFYQIRGMRRLRERKHVPSDEFAYYTQRHRRRLIAAGIMLVTSCLIAGSYLFGFERKIDDLTERKSVEGAANPAEKKPIADEEKTFAKLYGVYWGVVMVLACVLMMIAVTDAWATRRYWLKIYREMHDSHNAQLRRDLAVYRQQKEQKRATGRAGFGGRLGDGKPTDPVD